ncbi:MAG: hypothetical protein ACMV0I_07055 [Pseudomonas sp.]
MAEQRQELLMRLGFRFGISGTHAARTMMLNDLRALFAHTLPEATRADYASLIIDSNLLGKPTRKSRELTFRHLVSLYALTPTNPIFRMLRRLWSLDDKAQPMLALAMALARDPLLRSSQNFFLEQPVGTVVAHNAVMQFLSTTYPDRFSPASLRSLARNIAGSWTSAGILQGKFHKLRASVPNSPELSTLLLFLGYLEGRTGQRLFSSAWMKLLGASSSESDALVNAASHRGLLVFMSVGDVKEVRFPNCLTPEEECARLEVSHVI